MHDVNRSTAFHYWILVNESDNSFYTNYDGITSIHSESKNIMDATMFPSESEAIRERDRILAHNGETYSAVEVSGNVRLRKVIDKYKSFVPLPEGYLV